MHVVGLFFARTVHPHAVHQGETKMRRSTLVAGNPSVSDNGALPCAPPFQCADIPREAAAARRPHWAAALITSLALTGCQSAMTNSGNTPAPPDNVQPSIGNGASADLAAHWPMRFFAHWFDASCYSTYGCKVRYGNYRRIDDDDKLKLSSASIGDKYPGNLGASWGPIRNFPPPAIVTWRSKDGVPLRAEIDMAEIFKDQVVLHNLEREEISFEGSFPHPEIILEVNDRTINVYMRATIWTKREQRPGRPLSNFRDDLIKAFSRTY